MSNELKPCPCCGGEAVVVELGGRAAFRVKCRNVSKCGIETEVFDTEEEAEKAWNRRTPSDHIVVANKKVDNNPPLTLDELRDMDGEPAYIVHPKRMEENEWVVCDKYDYEFDEFCATSGVGWFTDCYGDSWLAYRRKPEED